jgi:hypothetical protein
LKFFSSLPPSLPLRYHRASTGTKIFPFPSLCIRTHTYRSDISLPLDRAAPKYFPFPSLTTEHRVSLLPAPPPPLSATGAATPSLYYRCRRPLSLLLVPLPLSALPVPTYLPTAAPYLCCRRCPPSLHYRRCNILSVSSPLFAGATHLSTYRLCLICPPASPPLSADSTTPLSAGVAPLFIGANPSLYRP